MQDSFYSVLASLILLSFAGVGPPHQHRPPARSRNHDGLNANNSRGQLPVHDLIVESVDIETGAISGHFYLGGQANHLIHEPLLQVTAWTQSFEPAAPWGSIDATCHIVSTGTPEEGAKVHFDGTLQGMVDPSKFWISVQMKGNSPEPPRKEEISFAANVFPPEIRKAQTRLAMPAGATNNFVPVTSIRPWRYILNNRNDYAYTNKPNQAASFSAYILEFANNQPRLGLLWEGPNELSTGGPGGTDHRKYLVTFKDNTAQGAHHHMFFTAGWTHEAGSDVVIHEWSGVIRPN